jgi:hypothetical protein
MIYTVTIYIFRIYSKFHLNSLILVVGAKFIFVGKQILFHPVVHMACIYALECSILKLLENTCMQETLALLTKPLYFPNIKYLQ